MVDQPSVPKAARPAAARTLGQLINEKRRRSHFRTQKSLAEAALCSDNVVSDLANAIRPVPWDRVQSIAKALDTDPTWLHQVRLQWNQADLQWHQIEDPTQDSTVSAGDEASHWAGVVELLGTGGELPRARELDPYMLGATPTLFGDIGRSGHGEDPYVERTYGYVDAQLTQRLPTSDFVLVTGPSKAGKTRTLFEAVYRTLPEARVAVPAKDTLPGLAEHPAYQSCDDVVVLWLDDLDRFLPSLTPTLLSQLTAPRQRRVIVATMRSEIRYRLLHGSADPDPAIVKVLRRASRIELRPTSEDPDEQAAAHASYPELRLGHFGLAEVLAGAPELLSLYGGARHAEPILHNVIQVAIDWARIGRDEPIPEPALIELTLKMLRQQHPNLDSTEAAVHAAIAVARTPPTGGRVAALSTEYLPDRTRGYSAFEYLVATDSGQGGRHGRRIPDAFWDSAILDADADTLTDIGIRSLQHGDATRAEMMFRLAARPSQPRAMYNLGVSLTRRGERAQGQRWYHKAARAGHPGAMNNLGVLLEERARMAEAESWYRQAAERGHPGACYNLALVLNRQGDDEQAAIWMRKVAPEQSGYGSSDFLSVAMIYRRGFDQGDLGSFLNRVDDLIDAGETRAAQSWLDRAVREWQQRTTTNEYRSVRTEVNPSSTRALQEYARRLAKPLPPDRRLLRWLREVWNLSFRRWQ